MNLSPKYLNPSFCPLYPTNIYTCRVTTVPKMDGGHQHNTKQTANLTPLTQIVLLA